MNGLTIEYFVMVARLGSVSRAAISLGIEQSTLSRYIAKLEADVGVRLFHRSGRGVVLTDEGRALMEQAEKVMDALSNTRKLANQLSGQGPTQLVIAAQPTVAQLAFGEIAHRLKARFPALRLQFLEGLGHNLVTWLVEGKVDVAIIYVPKQEHLVHVDPLIREPLYCVSACDYPVPSADLSIGQLFELPMILPSTPHGLRAIAESLAQQHQCTLKLAMECDGSIVVTKRLVEAGHGCTILPLAGAQREIEQGLLKATPIEGGSLARTIAIATAKNRPSVSSLWEINQVIRHVVEDFVTTGKWPGVSSMSEGESRNSLMHA